jgi:hypothetical protein
MTEEWSQARRLESWPPPSLSRALADAGSVAASATFVARQPIYDSRMEVYGYELLFRAADESWADVENANEATASASSRGTSSASRRRWPTRGSRRTGSRRCS